MPRPLTCAQREENARFLACLAETGNSRMAARSIGRGNATMHERRAAHPAFALEWDAAVAAAHARFHLSGGKRTPEGAALSAAQARARARATGPVPDPRLRTQGGEAVVVRTKTGKLQLRFAQPDKLTRAAEQAFLLALSATANVRLSAAAAGASARAFYRRQQRDAAFAREMRLALAMGYDRLENAMWEAAAPGSGEYDAWQGNEPPPVPPLTPGEALQLLHLHEKTVRQGWDKPHRRRRRGESDDVYRDRLRAMWTAEKSRADEADARARAFAQNGGRVPGEGGEAERPPLPPLHLVTGWSKASGKPPHHPGVALFGGWRIADMERKKRRGDG
ncbi:MAG TPA: hypothetical protein VIA98_12945 [Allosphingosinicella sp.]